MRLIVNRKQRFSGNKTGAVRRDLSGSSNFPNYTLKATAGLPHNNFCVWYLHFVLTNKLFKFMLACPSLNESLSQTFPFFSVSLLRIIWPGGRQLGRPNQSFFVHRLPVSSIGLQIVASSLLVACPAHFHWSIFCNRSLVLYVSFCRLLRFRLTAALLLRFFRGCSVQLLLYSRPMSVSGIRIFNTGSCMLIVFFPHPFNGALLFFFLLFFTFILYSFIFHTFILLYVFFISQNFLHVTLYSSLYVSFLTWYIVSLT